MLALVALVALVAVAAMAEVRTKNAVEVASIGFTQPCGDDARVLAQGGCATTSTSIAFRVVKENRAVPVVLNFYLNGAFIQTFTMTKPSLPEETVKLNISNLPRSVFHHARLDVLASATDATVVQSFNRSFWLLEAWSSLENAEVIPTAGGVIDYSVPSMPFYAPRAGLFTAREARKILSYAKSKRKSFSETTVGEDEHVDASYRRTSKLIVSRDGSKRTEWIYERIEEFVTRLNAHFWNFELGGGHGAAACRLHESMQILQYKSTNAGFYDLHMDMGIYGYTHLRKLSVTVQLSPPENYAGGDLELSVGKKKSQMPRSVGSAVLFPSYILHTVRPVTRGTRYALVLWFSGCSSFR
jgi:PKHD-type hydroxylase